ncbi:flagellar assembly T-like protein [Hydrogenispora ethanolica]|uniref:Flagellar assembly T-like protein n=1 Tax=Hydrogenispora ethanolica TaxID=1082276 RepID=A0A4R1RFC0_HYDET|nr:CsgG/HfaB family protein [Hydrogenispora ethanolica]TCL64272.1 flagellar assembly T-like protein [Hydrogenispora ethanolica]
MRRKLWFILTLILLFGIFIFPTMAAEKLYKIAVLPFDDGSIQERWWRNSWDVGKGISDELTTALVNTQKFRVIEREQIDKVLQEQRFGASGMVDSNTAARLGKILGVQYLVMGRVTEFSFKSNGGGIATSKGFGLGIKTTNALVAIDARLVDTTTAEIVSAVTGRGEKKQTNLGLVVNWNAIAFGSSEFRKTILGEALRDAVSQLTDELVAKTYGNGPAGDSVLTGLVAYASGHKVIINLGSGDGIQPGMVFTIHHVIEVVRDPKTGEIIDEVTEPLAEISVGEVKEKSATCVILNVFSRRYSITAGDIVKSKR